MYGLRIHCRDVHGGCPFVEVKACGVHGVGANEFFFFPTACARLSCICNGA
jgi:hypothetical protein